jgi:hypothetical protein
VGAVIVQIIGLPGAGKTTLARALAARVNGVVWNADEVRQNLHVDLGFSTADRVEHARRMGWTARTLSAQGVTIIVDFICPTPDARAAFGKPDVLIWVDRVPVRDFQDTSLLWVDPTEYDVRIPDGLTVDEELKAVFAVTDLVDWRAPHALVLGRFQPWHEGHEWLYQEATTRTGNVVVGVRNTTGLDKDPLTFDELRKYMPAGRTVMQLPNITNVVYGRDVGYVIEQVTPPESIGKVSATQKREELGLSMACASCDGGCCGA